MLAPYDLNHLVTQLEEKRRALSDRVRRINAHLGSQATPEALAEDPGVIHQADEVLEHLSHEETRDLARIDAALERVRAGTYGLCASCEEVISAPRLLAVPWALRCQDCQREHELTG